MTLLRCSFATLVLALLLPFGTGCSPADGDDPGAEQGEAADLTVVWPGKEDDFISLSAREYILQGTTTVRLESSYAGRSEEEKLARVEELIPLKSIQVGWFLNVYLVKKDSDAANAGYGGYHALVREGSYKTAGIAPVAGDELAYTFDLTFEIGGESDLLRNMPVEHVEGDTYRFRLAMARVGNAELARLDVNREWYRRYQSWQPDGRSESEVEWIDLTIRPEERSADAYFDYARLFEDGKVTMAVHFGWDYHNDYHLVHSRALYDWLLARGYASPVASYDEYTRTSGPLTRTIQAGGQEVTVEISLFWGQPGTDTDPDTDAGGLQLENDMRDSFATREVIAYSGHSGPYYGFALANWNKTEEGDLDDSEIPGLELPEGTYQVVLAEGCDTYGVGEAFWHNPAKADRHDLDVITTTAPSNAATPATVQDFITALVGTDAAGNHVAKRVSELLDDLDGNSSWFHTMYGLHGVDDNPHAHPYANSAALCQEVCSGAQDCGGQGNRCVSLVPAAAKTCTFECTADDGCPEGYACERIAADGYMLPVFVCVPRARLCGGQSDDTGHGTLTEAGELARGEEKRFTIELEPGMDRLHVVLGGTGDVDLYVRRGEEPTTAVYDCRPYESSSDETCSFQAPAAGTWHILLRGYAESSSYELQVMW